MPEQVKAEIEANLKIGDDAEKIERYFESKSMGVTYDKYQNRYSSIIRHPKTNYKAVTIYVYVDDQKRFKKVETRNSYTMP